MKKAFLLICLIVLLSSLGCAPTMTSQERRQNYIDTFSWGMSEIEKKAVANGVVITGMHYGSVRASWGDPCNIKDKIDNRSMGLSSYESWIYGPSKCVYIYDKYDYRVGGFIQVGDSYSVIATYGNSSEKLDIGPLFGISKTYLLFVNERLHSVHGSK